jgi:hypothetical protein
MFEKPPAIDGSLADEVWKSAAVLKDFYQVQPGDNSPPSKPTEVMLGYDAKFLYVAFRAHDDPGQVRANVAKRDQISDDDFVTIVLDTFDDKRKAYVLSFNPLGIQADAILTEGRGEDYSVDVVMESRGVVTDSGYTVEVAVPFKSLRYTAGKGKRWGVHALRRIKRFNNEQDSWMPIVRDKSGFLTHQGYLTGLEGVAAERTLEFIPSLTLLETGTRVRSIPRVVVQSTPGLLDEGRFINPPFKGDPGLTAKLGITSTSTLALAINPDFAQVEADQLVVTANQRFPIFYPERRPFFLEGIDVFQTNLLAFHSRAIVDPDVAVKLTGKHGRNTFGLLAASDNGPGSFNEQERTDPFVLPGIQRFLDKNAYIAALRLKRDIGKGENTIGLIATTYNFIEKHNHLGGLDGRFRLDKKTTLDLQMLGTHSRAFFFDPDRGSNVYRTGNGLAYLANYNVSGRNFGWQVYGEGYTRHYRADVGFVSRLNSNFNSFLMRYISDPKPKARLVSWRLQNFSHMDYTFQGNMYIWENESSVLLNFQRQGFLGLAYERAYERVFEEEFGRRRTPTRSGAFAGPDDERSSNKHHIFLSGGAQPGKRLGFNFRAVYRLGHFDYDFGNGRKFPRVSPRALLDPRAPFDPGRGGLFEFSGFVAYQPTSALRTTLNFNKNRLLRYDTNRVAFDDNIYSWRTTYQFTPYTFMRARIDYTTLSSRARGQFLLGWTPNPGTAFYVGYNDDHNRNGFNPFTGQFERGFRRNSRTFFIKMSYLFRRAL